MHKTAALATILISCAAFISGGAMGFWRHKVAFVVPSGFEGLIRVRETARESPGVISTFFKLQIAVPPSGEIGLRSLRDFRGFRKFVVIFEGGEPIPEAFMGSEATGVRFWHLNAPPSNQVYFYVGTHQEMDTFLEANETALYAKSVVD